MAGMGIHCSVLLHTPSLPNKQAKCVHVRAWRETTILCLCMTGSSLLLPCVLLGMTFPCLVAVVVWCGKSRSVSS